MAIKKENKLFLLKLLQESLDENKIDLQGLEADIPGSAFRNFRPFCDCWGTLSPKEETWNWHTHHVNKCLKGVLDALDFLKEWENLVIKESKRFSQEKKQVWKKIKEKARKLGFSNISGKWEIMNCTNKKLLKDKEDSKITYLENLVNAWQKKSEAEKEENKRQEEERIKQEQQKAEKKKQEEKTQQKEQEFKERIKEEKQKTNPKSDRELNKLKNKFNEVYREEKKYKLDELRKLLHVLEKIEKETGLDNNLQTAKNELQTIWDKSVAHYATIDYCRHLIEKEGNSEGKEEELDKYRLEECKKVLEELEKIVCLYPQDENLLKKINDKLKTLNLEEELRRLKNQKTDNPQQQTENQKKIEAREKELEEIKKQAESKENKQFQVSPQILSKFKPIPNFNTKEKIEVLINPVKDNPEFLQEIQTKHQSKDLNALFATKSSEEIIKIIKRFEYDNLSPKDKENKDKKIKTYYQQLNQLAKNGKLTNEQINNYLYKESVGKLKSGINSIIDKGKQKENNNTSIFIFASVLFLGIFSLAVLSIKKQKKNYTNQVPKLRKRDIENYNTKIFSPAENEIMEKNSCFVAMNNFYSENNLSDNYKNEVSDEEWKKIIYENENFEASY
ncbi:MAG: hypothetical protein I3274_07365 [Candidatus Moeniiplasma glomeromycotorum]|nr:hypothetical protein [Candidatus Moeniiplasma glomeromycotorum]MCE8168165.1 hypothetical protein [Candidatus Moeniiplasma glomeromycotorum]